MKKMSAILAAMLLGLFAAGASAMEGISVNMPWVNEAPPHAAAMAGYMMLKNGSDQPRVLVGASSPAFASAMLHRTVMQNGMAKMLHQKAIVVPAHGTVTFEPNGYHIMLMKPKKHYVAGDKLKITLRFKNGEKITTVFPVRKGEGMPMGNMKMDHGM